MNQTGYAHPTTEPPANTRPGGGSGASVSGASGQGASGRGMGGSGSSQVRDGEHRAPTVPYARRAAAVPLIISVSVQWIFFIQYWIPELGSMPARDWWLTQLAPLNATLLTSVGRAQVPVQDGLLGAFGLMLLLASFLLYWSSRTAHPRGPLAMAGAAALGLACTLGILISLGIRGGLAGSAVGVVVLLVWLASAGYATSQRWLDPLGPVPTKRRRHGLRLLLAYALLGPAPTAVGRWLFAPELRDLAAELQGNTVALRLAALWTPGTALLYLSGLVVGITVWIAYQWWPPRREPAFVGFSILLAVMLVLTGALAWPASTVAARRVTTLIYASPSDTSTFGCGGARKFIAQVPPGQFEPARTLLISGTRCTRATLFLGYRQTATYPLKATLAPVRARTPDGLELTGRHAEALYGDVLVIAGTKRIDSQADRLIGLHLDRSDPLWELTCTRLRDFRFRFAAAPAGDDPAAGQITRGEAAPTVVTTCGGEQLSFDPAVGPPK